MSSYLICWKPATENKEKGWPEEELAALAELLQKTGSATEDWRFKQRNDVHVGERVFLLRQGKRGFAILGFGTVAKPPKKGEGWTKVSFDVLLHPRSKAVLATQQELKLLTEKNGVWNTMASGLRLDDDIALQLEALVVDRDPVADEPPGKASASSGWSREELESSVHAYLEMRALWKSGTLFSKKKYYSGLSKKYGRSEKAFEYRMQNISHVLSLMGRDWIPGLIPAKNVGDRIAALIEELIFEIEGQRSQPVASFEQKVLAFQSKPPSSPPSGTNTPKKKTIQVTEYDRDPKVVAWILHLAKGKCECCQQAAPFVKDDGSPFLEVHHVLRLADKGPDTPENAVALCPNCHRQLHHGKDRIEIIKKLRASIPRLKKGP